MKKSNNRKRIVLNIMSLALVSTITGLLGIIFIDSINTISSITKIPTPKTDYILHIKEDKNNKESIYTNKNNRYANIDDEIDGIKERTKSINNYTKQYKERIDYNKDPISSEVKDYKHNIISEDVKQEIQINKDKQKIINNTGKPKIAIIIDDVASKTQLDEILNIDLKLTPSIFPISSKNKKMIAAVNKLDFFMVHLPLEAKQYRDGLDTIKISDSKIRIENKIKDIKDVFPNVKYINNHTGSKFTEDKKSMEILLEILNKYNIDFLDSRTTPNSALGKISKNINKEFLYRDIFVDNNLSQSSLNAQLKNGVKLAESKGYAILIAHPHKETLEAIKNAKNNILKSVDIVYINELDKLLQPKRVAKNIKDLCNEC